MAGGSIRRAPLRAAPRPSARQVAVAGLFGLGVPELAVIAGVAALIFGEQGAWGAWGPAAHCRRRCLPPPPPARRPMLPPLPARLSGPSKLPELGKGLGKTVKSFQTAAKVRGHAVAHASPVLCRARRSREPPSAGVFTTACLLAARSHATARYRSLSRSSRRRRPPTRRSPRRWPTRRRRLPSSSDAMWLTTTQPHSTAQHPGAPTRHALRPAALHQAI